MVGGRNKRLALLLIWLGNVQWVVNRCAGSPTATCIASGMRFGAHSSVDLVSLGSPSINLREK